VCVCVSVCVCVCLCIAYYELDWTRCDNFGLMVEQYKRMECTILSEIGIWISRNYCASHGYTSTISMITKIIQSENYTGCCV
jgi:hypothetical protein